MEDFEAQVRREEQVEVARDGLEPLGDCGAVQALEDGLDDLRLVARIDELRQVREEVCEEAGACFRAPRVQPAQHAAVDRRHDQLAAALKLGDFVLDRRLGEEALERSRAPLIL